MRLWLLMLTTGMATRGETLLGRRRGMSLLFSNGQAARSSALFRIRRWRGSSSERQKAW
jgi:hypothetical protein